MANTINTWLLDPYALVRDNAITGEDLPAIHEEFCREVDHDGTLSGIYHQLSYEKLNVQGVKVSVFQPVDVGAVEQHKVRGDMFYVDEEGLYNNPHDVWWTFKGGWQAFAGKALVMGTTPSGKDAKPKVIDREWIIQNCVIGCQNIIYVPRMRKAYVVGGRGALNMIGNMAADLRHPVWTEETLP